MARTWRRYARPAGAAPAAAAGRFDTPAGPRPGGADAARDLHRFAATSLDAPSLPSALAWARHTRV